MTYIHIRYGKFVRKKYIKYRTKYENLKKIQVGGQADRIMDKPIYNQNGGVFNNLVYLGQGAESVVFKTEDGKAIKVIKNHANRISATEQCIMQQLSALESSYFPKVYAIGLCKNDHPVTEDTKTFCVGSKGAHEYQYILMDAVDGKDMMNIFYAKFKTHIQNVAMDANDPDLVAEIEEFSAMFIRVYAKLAEAFKLAHDGFGFRHGDFDYRNCVIKEDGTPVVVDFGASFLARAESNCKDMMGFYRSMFGGTYCGTVDVTKNFFPTRVLSEPSRNAVIILNCKDILNKVKSTVKMARVDTMVASCSPFTRVDITYDSMKAQLESIRDS